MIKRKIICLIVSAMLAVICCSPVKVNAENSVYEVRVCAVGDNIMHKRVIQSGVQEDGSLDYTDIYRYYKNYLKNYDICAVNQETVFVESDSDFSAYPKFGGPEEVGLALMDAGFNTVTTATNHIMDKGIDSVWYSHWFWTGWGIEPVGTYTNQEVLDMETGKYVDYHALFMTKNNIRIGMLNYTYGTNGLPIPEDSEWMIGTLYDKERIAEEMKYVDSRCDVMIVFPHWGTEYQYEPSSYQKEWAQFFADNGADVIIGTHPHVIEPLVYITSINGKRVPCYYSLGNFMANQDEVPRMLGAAATFTIKKRGDRVSITDVKVVPTITHISSYSEEFYAKSLFDYTSEEERSHRMRRVRGSEFSISNLWELWYSVFSELQTADFK